MLEEEPEPTAEEVFARYAALASRDCAVVPSKTGAALFIRRGALVHVGLLTRLTLGSLKRYARHGALTHPGAG